MRPQHLSRARLQVPLSQASSCSNDFEEPVGFTLPRAIAFGAHPHTAVTNVYRASRDLFLAQRFARHVSPLTTTIYTHPSDEELFEKVRTLTC